MTKSHSIDYGDVLSDLRAKRKEFDKAIASIEALSGKGLLSSSLTAEESPTVITPALINSRGKGAYEATVDLLGLTKKPMKTKDIFQELLNHGVISKDTKLATVAATLYKSVKQKTNCKIKQAGKGEWVLK